MLLQSILLTEKQIRQELKFIRFLKSTKNLTKNPDNYIMGATSARLTNSRVLILSWLQNISLRHILILFEVMLSVYLLL